MIPLVSNQSSGLFDSLVMVHIVLIAFRFWLGLRQSSGLGLVGRAAFCNSSNCSCLPLRQSAFGSPASDPEI